MVTNRPADWEVTSAAWGVTDPAEWTVIDPAEWTVTDSKNGQQYPQIFMKSKAYI
jgi:hypothetical protein